MEKRKFLPGGGGAASSGQMVACPHCHEHIVDDGTHAGQVVLCPHCHRRIKIPRSRSYFLCNTNRRTGQGRRPEAMEELMHFNSHAVAWEPFNYPKHINRVKSGDFIFMYVNDGVGVVAIGEATGACRAQLAQGHPRRLRQDSYHAPEWNVPVRWLEPWRPDNRACSVPKYSLVSFIDVSGHTWAELRAAVMQCFPNVPW
jgi:hypothetical protein